MEKQKRWQFLVICAVCVLTLYNILPTIIFYSKPLNQPVDAAKAQNVANDIAHRVNSLEEQSVEWIASFCKLLNIEPTSIELKKEDPSQITVSFAQDKDAQAFSKLLPRAGSLIPFVPAQLTLLEETSTDKKVQVLRQVGIHFDEQEIPTLFQFAQKEEHNGTISKDYFAIASDRFTQVAVALGGTSPLAEEIHECNESTGPDLLIPFAQKILRITESFGASSPFAQRFFASFTQTENPDAAKTVATLISKMEEEKHALESKRQGIVEEKKLKEEQNQLIDAAKLNELDILQEQISILDRALKVLLEKTETPVTEAKTEIKTETKPFTKKMILDWLSKEHARNAKGTATYTLVLGQRNPIIREVLLDWGNDTIYLKLHPDVLQVVQAPVTSETSKLQQEEMNRLVMNELARLGQRTDEGVRQGATDYFIPLYQLQGSQSLLTLNLKAIADKISHQTLTLIQDEWTPSHIDLAREKLPLFDAKGYAQATNEQKRLCLVVLAPASADSVIPGLRGGSIYVILRGLQSVIDQYHRFPTSQEATTFSQEMQDLAKLLQKRGFIGYAGGKLGPDADLSRDFIFELDDYYSMLLAATRESFYVLGNKENAALEFSDIEQRILTQNRIDDAIQEDLLRWKESYHAAQVDLDPLSRYTVPKPTENAYLANCKRAARAYVRGDDSKIIRWGLDLSGGKSVRVVLYDHSNRQVTNPEDLRQAVNELYARINKMGVSERTIRIENSSILIDFPGAQGLSAAELIKASAMYFHVVNEQFGPFNHQLAKEVNEFLQDVWNEAVVTNKKETHDINEIAYHKLQTAASRTTGQLSSVKDAAQILYQAGLRLVDPNEYSSTAAFDDTLSRIAKFRDDDISQWNYQGHPLLIMFANYALDGASLENIQTGYDPSKGNILTFDVKSAYSAGRQEMGSSPRDDFYTWTAQFSEEKIAGTAKEAFSKGRGWRMAVVLNDVVISSPSLNAALRDHVMISGNFTQREVSKLATDLKAGSLTFTPRILSEQNVSPELGQQERMHGIIAALVGVALVVIMMISYYRFGGIVASIAVLFNILVIWAVLQNIEFALTLPGIAGMVLTVAMAVDANVLVFERIREEFQISGRIASAIQLGYKKAFSAIWDSNLTTLIAALILLQFDAGPIRGFAVTLVIGIIASMFTALFMTRYFFAGWVQNPQHKELKMAQWIKNPNFDFLKWTKTACIASLILFVVGIGVTAKEWKSLFGMDFTGGYSLVVDLKEKEGVDYRSLLSEELLKRGLSTKEFQIRELGRPNLLRIQLGISLEQEGRPFNTMPIALEGTQVVKYEYQKNPRIVWLVDAIQKSGLSVKEAQSAQLAASWTAMSGQFSDAMRNNAAAALSLALLAVLFYIAFRFEWKFAVSAVLALLHDVILTVCVLAIAHALGAPVQIDLEVIGAIMTIIGYSLNDTIIVFDRIREDMRIMRKKSFAEIINLALNTTLSRTLMTSGTTLLVLISLVLLGGETIFGFSFVMLMGVFLGTFSSLFIACPILLWLGTRENEAHKSLSQAHA